MAYLSTRRILNGCRLTSVLLQKSNLHVSQNIVKSKYEDVPLSRLPYFEFVWSNKDKYGDKIALVRMTLSFWLNIF
jgi:hypothetical protein